ncbi:hypothetical protein ACFOGJ_08775 [Marinibaculum pumilum]|uniref:Uncharacterized protein n=1 Tax=Marinibaculum pumilum TaxID=1766165 RepID=A0ABV7KY34_9PROT
MLAILIAAAAGAILFRLRGDAWLRAALPWWGTLEGRLLYAGGTAAVAVAIAGAAWWWLPILVAALWLGSVFGWWQTLDMGTQTGSRARDIALHSLRGVLWTLPAGLAVGAGLDLQAGALLALSGAAAGPLYALAMLVPWQAAAGPVWISRQDGNGVNTEAGECLFGAWIGGALALALA